MERFSVRSAAQGVVGGVIAGTVVAAWFFVTDAWAGSAFETPTRLANAVLHTSFNGPWPRAVLAYTVMHYGVFVSLGVAGLWALTLLDLEPGLLVGAGFGLGVLNAVHYGGVLVTNANLLTVVPVAQVVLANLLGGIAMMAYLHRALAIQSPFGLNALRSSPVAFGGVTTGLIGAAAVAFWFLLVDLAKGGPFLTPAILGSALLLGSPDRSAVLVGPGVIAAYTFAHIAVFVVLGLVFVRVMSGEQATSNFWARLVALLVLVEALFYGTLFLLGGWVVQQLGWFVILVANAVAAASMGLWIRGRGLSTVPARRGQARAAAPRAEHVITLRTYWVCWGILLVLTMIMLLLEGSGFPREAAVLFLVIAMLIKATVIAAWFMHLRYERVALVASVAGATLATAAVLFFLLIPDALNVAKSAGK